jgi:hypothetical protein
LQFCPDIHNNFCSIKDQEIGFDSVDRENVHNILNSPITEEEILRVVKNLKSNKASGYDDIVNELQCTVPLPEPCLGF